VVRRFGVSTLVVSRRARSGPPSGDLPASRIASA
jgi:hypothetical protein